MVVTVNMLDRDIGSFVAEAQQAILKGVKLPAGYWLAWGGTVRNLQNAAQRLKVVVPASLALAFVLLFLML